MAALVEALSLATWHGLSDARQAEALSNRASFRRFCGFAREEATPGRAAFVRFRRLLVDHCLDQSPFEAIVRDLEQKGARVRKGLPSGSDLAATRGARSSMRPSSAGPTKGDEEAAWARRLRSFPSSPGHVFGDKAYYAESVKKAIEDKGGSVKIPRTGHRWLSLKKIRGAQSQEAVERVRATLPNEAECFGLTNIRLRVRTAAAGLAAAAVLIIVHLLQSALVMQNSSIQDGRLR